MSDHSRDAELRRMLLEKRGQGRLPDMITPHAWAGRGSGEQCVLCESPIDSGQIEFEVEYAFESGTRLLRFHELCYRLWSEP